MAAQIQLLHLKGINGALRGAVRAHPTIPGKVIYVTGSQIVVADEAELTQQALLRGHDTPITSFSLSPNGLYAASGNSGRNADVVLWDMNTLTVKTRFAEHDMEVVSLSFSTDDRLLMSAGHEEKDQKLFVLDTSTGKIVSKGLLDFRKRVTASAWAAPKGTVYEFATAADSEVTLWNLDPYTGMLSQRKVVTGSVRRQFTSMVYSPDGQWLYAGTTTGDVVTINVIRGAMQLVHPACSNGVGAMVLSSSGRLLVGGGDGSITLFTNDHMWRDMRPFVVIPGAPITSLSPNADGSALILGTSAGSVLRVASGTFASSTLSAGHTRPITRVVASAADPSVYVSSAEDGTVRVWSAADQSLQASVWEGPAAGPALSLAVLGQDLVVSGWGDGAIRAHARSSAPPGGQLRQAWFVSGAHSAAHSCGVTALAAAHRGHFVVSGGAGGEIRMWDARSREMAAHMKMHMQPVNDIAVLGDDAHLLAACEDRSLSAWDLGSQKCMATWRLSTSVRSVAVAGDQVTFVSAGAEKNVSVWDLRAPDPVATLRDAHEGGEVRGIALTQPLDAPLGAVAPLLLATGGADGVVKMWDLRAPGQQMPSPAPPLRAAGAAHTGAVTSLAFAPGGDVLYSGAADCTIGTWLL